MRHAIVPIFTFLIRLFLWSAEASAFCGFYVGKADTKLFNKASEVVIARQDNKTVITLATTSRAMSKNSRWSYQYQLSWKKTRFMSAIRPC